VTPIIFICFTVETITVNCILDHSAQLSFWSIRSNHKSYLHAFRFSTSRQTL